MQLLKCELLTGSSMKRPDPTRQSLRLRVSRGVMSIRRPASGGRPSSSIAKKLWGTSERCAKDACREAHASGDQSLNIWCLHIKSFMRRESRTLDRIKFDLGGPERGVVRLAPGRRLGTHSFAWISRHRVQSHKLPGLDWCGIGGWRGASALATHALRR